MTEHLYIIVTNRHAEKQAFENNWAEKGMLKGITTTPGVLAAADKALAQGGRVFIYETKCSKRLGTHVSQEVRVAEVSHGDDRVAFKDHLLLYRKPPFRVTQGMHFKWSKLEPTDAMV
jgi:hypothetical protein